MNIEEFVRDNGLTGFEAAALEEVPVRDARRIPGVSVVNINPTADSLAAFESNPTLLPNEKTAFWMGRVKTFVLVELF